MKECPSEPILQSYLDEELSSGSMESVRLHLASCVACSVAARQFVAENNLVASALAPEFAASVPTDRLRSRIDAAIANATVYPVVAHTPVSVKTSGWFKSLSDLFTFKPQQALGYAGLAAVLIFAVVFAVIQLQSSRQGVDTLQAVAINAPENSGEAPEATISHTPTVVETPAKNANVSNPRPHRRKSGAKVTSRDNSVLSNHVKLLPGERSYLQTIAELDSTIKQGDGQMRPAIQAEYERNLAFVDRALAAARTAAKSKPNDPDAAEFMFSAYRSKVDLMNAVADARVYNRQQ